MEIGLAPIQCEEIESHCSNEQNIISKSSNQQTNFDNRSIRKTSTAVANTLKLRKWFYPCMKSRKMKGFGIIFFISLSITVGVLIVCLTVPKQSNTCTGDFQRMLKSSLISSSQPRTVATGDFNNDQQQDIVVANYGTDTIGIFVANDNGTFAEQKTYSTGSGSRPYSVVTSDFNNDSYSDIAVANYGTNNIGILLGNKNGTFNNQQIFALASSRPVFITSGDFNKDNQMDIAVVNYGTNNIGILLGYGNGSFQDQITYSTGYDSYPSSLVIADFNNDTYLDIAVANHGTDNIGIFLGYGNGTFASQRIYSTFLKSNPSSIAVGDFNSDHKLDIVVANNGSGSVGIFLGDGNGSFQSQITYLIGSKSYPQYITVADLNNDDQLDVVVIDYQNDQVHILRGFGNGSFAPITTYDDVSRSGPFGVAMTDFNGNNQSDIVIVNSNTNNVLVLMDYFVKLSARQKNYNVKLSVSTVTVAVSDFNNDHILDIVYATYEYILIRNGVGDGTFNNEISYPIPNSRTVHYICVDDLNSDNNMDIVFACPTFDDIGVLLGYGNSSFTPITSYSTGLNSDPWWITLADVNNDHRLDIISANTGSNTIGILLGHGDGTFDTVMTYSTGIGTRPYSVAVGDLNNDSYLDLAVVNANNHVVIFIGYGNGTFTISNVFLTVQGATSFTIALADFNSDNHLDIVVTNTNANNLGIFLGLGNCTFGTQTLYSTGSASQPFYVMAADFSNDNISDIVTTNFGSDEVAMFYGLGDGSFQLDRIYSTGIGSKPNSIAAGDFDNDKQLDIVVALSGTSKVGVLTAFLAAAFRNETKCRTGSAPQPYSVAVADFNNDNRSDIVVANSGTDNLGILFGLDNDTFDMTKKYPFDTDSYPQYVITYDINQDDQLDVISVNSKADSISVIMGFGNGTFAEQQIYSTGIDSQPGAVVVGDFNSDNRVDLVVANQATNGLGIFYGFNYTIFQNQKIYSNDDSLRPVDIVVHDFNDDNHLDIASTFSSSNKIGILFGDGNGDFTSMLTYSTGSGSEPYGIAVGDFNNDDRSDIVVANSVTSTIGIFLGLGNGSFANITTYSTGKDSSPLSVSVGDFNNDNCLDVVVANQRSNSVGILLGYGSGSFSIVKIYSTGDGSNSLSATVGDFNNDRNLDIVVANINTHNVGVFLGYGNGTFGNQIIFTMTLPMWVVVGDFNNDNQLDFAAADRAVNYVGIFIGYGNGTFAAMRTYSAGDGSSPTYVSVGDFNNDNKSDIAVVNEGTNSIVVLFGLGDGSFLLGKPHSTGIGSIPCTLAIGDFNNDNRLDIAVANNYANNIGVFLSYGNQPFGSMKLYTSDSGSRPNSVAVSDLNNDGDLDIVVVNSGSDVVSILLGHGNGNFDKQIPYSTGTGSTPLSVDIAHFNNDNYLDIVVVNSQTDNILILLGYGNGTFANVMNYSTGADSYPYTVKTGDFNNDNRTDIVVANYGTSNILLFYGHGDGTFENETSYTLGYGYSPSSIAVEDLNQDNWLDIVIACYGTDHVETLINTCKKIGVSITNDASYSN